MNWRDLPSLSVALSKVLGAYFFFFLSLETYGVAEAFLRKRLRLPGIAGIGSLLLGVLLHSLYLLLHFLPIILLTSVLTIFFLSRGKKKNKRRVNG